MKQLIDEVGKIKSSISRLFMGRATYLVVQESALEIVQTQRQGIIYNKRVACDELTAGCKEAAYFPRQVSLVLPSTRIFTRVIDLPAEAKTRLEEIIGLKFLDDLPCSREEVYYSYYPAITGEERLKVILFAVEKDYLDRLCGLCKEHQLTVTGIIPAGLIYYLYYSSSASEQPNLYIDEVGDYYQYTFLTTDDIYLRASWKQDLAAVVSYLGEEHNLEVSPPKEELEIKTWVKKRDWVQFNQLDAEEFWASAAETRKLLGGREFIDISSQFRQQQWWQIGIVGVLLLVTMLLNFGLHWKLEQQKLNTLQQKLAAVEPVVKKVNQLRKETRQLQQETQALEKIIKPRQGYLPWTKELGEVLGAKVVIEQLNFNGGELTLLAGTAPSANEVITKLEESSYFKNLSFNGSIVTQNNRERFRIVGELANAAE